MKLSLHLIFYGLFLNNIFSLSCTTNRFKRHIWRGNPVSQSYGPTQHAEIKTSGSRHPASLHRPSKINEITCDANEIGLKPHPVNCQMYIACWNGKSVVETCSDGFLFDPISEECDFASKVACATSGRHSAKLQHDSYNDDPEYVDVADTDRENINGFDCTEEGIFEHPNDCSKFIQCAHSELFIQSCGPGTMFNPSLKVCDWPYNVNCKKNVNANIQYQPSHQDGQFVHEGQRTRPDDAVFDFDVRMADINTRSENKEQQDRIYQTSNIQRTNQRHNNDQPIKTHQLHSHRTIEFSRPEQRSLQFQPEATPQPPSQSLSPPHQSLSPPNQLLSPPHQSLSPPHQSQSPPHNIYPAESQSRSFQSSFQSQPNIRSNNNGVLTSVLPIHKPQTQHNENLVHSSPSYSKTKIYSAQHSHPDHEATRPTKPTASLPQYNPSHSYADRQNNYDRDYDYQREQLIRQSATNRNENVEETMDLLDNYANMNTQSRRESKANIMTVSNRDHEVPIYNRPQNLRVTSRISEDLQTQQTENMNAALKLLLLPYVKSQPLQNADVNQMSTKLFNVAENEFKEETTTIFNNIAEGPYNVNTAVSNKQIPSSNFNAIRYENKPQRSINLNENDNLRLPTPTPHTETISNFNVQTNSKIGTARINALLEDNESKKYSNSLNRPTYDREEIELFCTNGFDCGNGVCVSSEKICDGRDNCGNRMDEKNCKHIGYDIRLSGDSDRRNMGRIEVKVFNRWGHICDDKFGLNEANVLCREVGFPLGAVEVKANSYYPPHVNMSSIDDSPMFEMDELRCTGNESSLKDCNFNGWGFHDCNSEDVVGVVCKLPDMKCQLNYWLCDQSEECIPTSFLCDAVTDCSDGSDESPMHCNSSIQYRLGNPKSNQKEGRVEVRYRGIWGTVCDDDFGENEAKVFCRSLGYEGAAAVIKEFVEPGEGLIWLDQVSCDGNETSLEKCNHFEWGENNCNHTEDVSVRCYEPQVETYQKLTMRERKGALSQLNQIPRRSKSEQEHCGQIRVSDDPNDYDDQPVFKVIEGKVAKRGHHPWQATIRVRGRNGKSSHWCGAVLISKTHLLTAAHCLIGFTKNSYFIRLGDHHSEVVEDTEIEIFIEDWHIHEKFRKGHLMNNDIALIKLKSPVKFTDYIQPICLPTEGTEYTAGKNCSISGWGSIQYGKSTPSLQLRSAYIPIMSEEICKQTNIYGSSIQSGMFCAGIPENMIDACDGDSGGPFSCSDGGEQGYQSLYGIISWGQRCGDKHKPGVYTKVVEYLPWIQEKLML